MKDWENFVTCHCHPRSLDSGSTPEAFVKRELELGTGYVTVTDHGTLGAARQIYDLAKKNKITPIIGLEAYLRDDNCSILAGLGYPKNANGAFTTAPKYMHVTLHAQDQAAYECMVRLLSAADARLEVTLQKLEGKDRKHGQERKPLFTWADLEELGGHNVTMTTGCMIGAVQRHLLDNNDPKAAKAYFEKLKSIVKPGNLFTEVFPHDTSKNWVSGIFLHMKDGTSRRFYADKTLRTDAGEIKAERLAAVWSKGEHHTLLAIKDRYTWVPLEIGQEIERVEHIEAFLPNECRPWAPNGDLQAGLNRAMKIWAKEYGVPVIIGDDSHYAHPNEKIVQDVRLSQGGAWKFYGSYHRQSSAEAYAHFQKTLGTSEGEFESWVDNSREWASRFKNFKFETPVSIPTKFYEAEYFTRPWYKEGNEENSVRYTMELIKKHGRMDWSSKAMVDRLRAEINLLHHNGTIDLLPYFMIDEEVCSVYEKAGLLTGPGRGSAAGLILTYLLGITHVDPLKYGLSMDRFLTIDRIKSGKLPDIDQDLPNRDLLVDPVNGWLKQRFGDHYAQISVDTTLKLKSAVKDVARSFHRKCSNDKCGLTYVMSDITPDIGTCTTCHKPTNGVVPQDVEAFTRKFEMPPQGVSDVNFVMGYTPEGSDEFIEGSIKTDEALKEYVRRYPREWEVVVKCLGLARQKSRHACLPAGESILVKGLGPTDIVKCDGLAVYTGQGELTSRGWQQSGTGTLLEQGVREVVEYTLDTGLTFRCTPDHLVLTSDGWHPVQTAMDRGLDLVPAMNRTPLTERGARDYAQKRGGALVNWGGNASSVSTWRCSVGHTWNAKGSVVFSYEYWCRTCSHQYRFKPSKQTVSIARSAAKCLSTYRRYDAKKGLENDLEVADVARAKTAPCVYCLRTATGFERIDNQKGHTRTNCVPACLRCNWMRGRYVSHDTMLQIGKLLTEIDP